MTTNHSKATPEQIAELARTIETQANAIAEGRVVGPVRAAVSRLVDNVDTLAAWTGAR